MVASIYERGLLGGREFLRERVVGGREYLQER